MIGLTSSSASLPRSAGGGTGGTSAAGSSAPATEGGGGCPFLHMHEAEQRRKSREEGATNGNGAVAPLSSAPHLRRQHLPFGVPVDGAEPPSGFKATPQPAVPPKPAGEREMRGILRRNSRMRAPSLTMAEVTARRNSNMLEALLGGSGLSELSSAEFEGLDPPEAQDVKKQFSVIHEESIGSVRESQHGTLRSEGEEEKKSHGGEDDFVVAGGKGDRASEADGESARVRLKFGPYPTSTPVPDNTQGTVGEEEKKTDSNAFKPNKNPAWNVATHGGPDDRDRGTPDEWIPRHKSLERLTGRHPFNAEPDLKDLRKSGFLTPGHLHFSRNHGPVPRLSWEDHTIEVRVTAGFSVSSGLGAGNVPPPITLSMDDLTSKLAQQELPVTLACISNRRSEQNAVRRTLGFSWGAGAVATSVFRGARLRDILLKAGVSSDPSDWDGCHVEFLGADELPNKVGPGPFEKEDGAPWGKKIMGYGTSVPLGKAMDPARDMLVAYEANGEPLPPDHGYPVRAVVPGSTGGRWVKWLSRISVLPHESHNLYHHHDNKILPPHVLDLESSLDPEKRWWYQNEYIVHELNINSAIVSPGHGDIFQVNPESSPSNDLNSGSILEVSGYAYTGGGRKVTRVEVSLDSGTNWDLADLTRTETPTSHDMYWCWIFWSARIPARLLLGTAEVWCRAWDETNNTQPDHLTWNLMGLGNNSIYKVKVHSSEGGKVTFEHPTRPGTLEGGWMKVPGGLPESAGFGRLKSKEEQQEEAQAEKEVSQLQQQGKGKVYTMEEVASHNTKDDVWIVVNNRVYDCSEYLKLDSHPGGPESIVIGAGKDCTKDFTAMHSVGTNKLLEEYYIGDLDEADAVDNVESSPDNAAGILAMEDEVGLDEDDPVLANVSKCLDKLDEVYGISTGGEDPFKVALVTSGWAKIVANEDMFVESLLGRWRLLVAMEEIYEREEELKRQARLLDTGNSLGESDMDEMAYALRMSGIDREAIEKFEVAIRGARTNRKALDMIRNNDDPLARCLGAKLAIAKDLLLGLLDAAISSLQPSVSWNKRYDEVDLQRLGMISGTAEEYARSFNRSGIQPEHWIMFCEAFLWSVSTHVPDASAADLEDLGKAKEEGAYASFVSNQVARFVTKLLRETREEHHGPAFTALVRVSRALRDAGDEAKALIGETFYQMAFTTFPELVQYFPHTDMDAQALHIIGATEMLIETAGTIGTRESPWHDKVNDLNRIHKIHQIPTNSYQMIGGTYLKVLRPLLKQEAEKWRNSQYKITADDLESAFSSLYVDVMGEVSASMILQEKVVQEAEEFMVTASKELTWSEDKLNTRLMEIKLEIAANDTYNHTEEELEIGAHIAWRNAGMVGSLTVWDRRGFDTYEGMSQVVMEHLKVKAGKSPECIAVLFGAREKDIISGTRFWSPSYMEYAGYKDGDGTVIGDPKNIEFTKHLIKHGLWETPKKRSEYDLLPVIVKIPGQGPFAITIPDDLRFEVVIEHPTCNAISKLGLRWPAYAYDSNVNLCVGGVNYPCGVYNRTFVSTEVVSGLCRRTGLVQKLAEAMGISSSERLRRKRVMLEMEVAVLHSFSKQGYTVIEEDALEPSFEAQSKKEMEAGRNCPVTPKGGLSVLGRLQKGIRLVARFQGCSHYWKVTEATDNANAGVGVHTFSSKKGSGQALNIPRVLIAYGSETGTSEGTALRLSRALKLLKPIVLCLNDVAGLDIIKEQNVTHFIAICSTFNRGEFPHNAQKFADTPLAADALAGIKVAVLAFGSTVYPDFCRAGVALEVMLEGAGGKPFVPFTKVDGAKGAEGPVAEWLDLAKAVMLPKHLAASIRGESSQEEEAPIRNEMVWMKRDKEVDSPPVAPFSWPEDESLLCIGNEELMDAGDIETRSSRRITFQLPSDITYESGDHLSVLPLNSLSMVKRLAFCFKDELVDAASQSSSPLLECADEESIVMWQLQQSFDIISYDGDEQVDTQLVFDTPATLSDVMQARLDLTLRNNHQVFDLLALSTRSLYGSDGLLRDGLSDESMEKAKSMESHFDAIQVKDAKEKEAAFESFRDQYPTIVDFLEEHQFLCERHENKDGTPTTQLQLADLLAILPRQQARYYSISSSPMKQASTVSISVGVVHVRTKAGVAIHGVCSNYLARMDPSKDRAQVSVRASTFRGPRDVNDPVIMVGPGTGLAPMMGFLQDRAQILASSPSKSDSCHLFFGCRTRGDRIYGKLIDKWESEGILKHHLALSRSEEMPKTYVQDLMREMGEQLYSLLLCDTTSVYICGDARVANQCFEECIEVLRKYGRRSRVSAVMHLKKMRSQNRWQYDLWGTVNQFNEVRKEGHNTETMVKSASKWLKTFG